MKNWQLTLLAQGGKACVNMKLKGSDTGWVMRILRTEFNAKATGKVYISDNIAMYELMIDSTKVSVNYTCFSGVFIQAADRPNDELIMRIFDHLNSFEGEVK